jgi:DNA replication and repair protein RecF
MQLTSLTLQNFRNYKELTLNLADARVLALVGDNAQGKTNLLEAIAFLALGKSFRARHSLEALQWEAPHGRVKGEVRGQELEVFLQANPELRTLRLNQKNASPATFFGHLRVVLFTPEHLELVSGGPKLRRQYLDRVLLQMDPLYLDAFTSYQKLLKQRNALLKRIQFKKAQDWELDLWDLRLAQEAGKIWKAREHFLHFLKGHLEGLYQSIAGSKALLTLESKTQSERYEEQLLAFRSTDLRLGSTSLGPHRDDFVLKLKGHELAETGSRGECRSAVLALKIAEIHYLEEKTKQKPLLLLDDVFSELDTKRQAHLTELLEQYDAVITTTDPGVLHGLHHVKLVDVKAGQINS